MLDLVFVAISQVIKAKAVFLRIHNLTQLCLQYTALSCVQQALKDRILHALSIVDTLLCDLPQTFAAGSVLVFTS